MIAKDTILVPSQKSNFKKYKIKEIPGWRSVNEIKRNEIMPESKLPALIQNRSEYNKDLRYPNWKLLNVKSDSSKALKRKSIKPEAISARLRSEELEYQFMKEFERITGKNILIGDIITKQLPATLEVNAPTAISAKPLQKSSSHGYMRQNPKKMISINNIGIAFQDGSSSKITSAQQNSNNPKKNQEVQTSLPNTKNGIEEIFPESSSRIESAIIMPRHKTLLDFYVSEIFSGEVKSAEDAKRFIDTAMNKGELIEKSSPLKTQKKFTLNFTPKGEIKQRKNDKNESFTDYDEKKNTNIISVEHIQEQKKKEYQINKKESNKADKIDLTQSKASIKEKNNINPKRRKPNNITKVEKIKLQSMNSKEIFKHDFMKLNAKAMLNIQVINDDSFRGIQRSQSVLNNYIQDTSRNSPRNCAKHVLRLKSEIYNEKELALSKGSTKISRENCNIPLDLDKVTLIKPKLQYETRKILGNNKKNIKPKSKKNKSSKELLHINIPLQMIDRKPFENNPSAEIIESSNKEKKSIQIIKLKTQDSIIDNKKNAIEDKTERNLRDKNLVGIVNHENEHKNEMNTEFSNEPVVPLIKNKKGSLDTIIEIPDSNQMVFHHSKRESYSITTKDFSQVTNNSETRNKNSVNDNKLNDKNKSIDRQSLLIPTASDYSEESHILGNSDSKSRKSSVLQLQKSLLMKKDNELLNKDLLEPKSKNFSRRSLIIKENRSSGSVIIKSEDFKDTEKDAIKVKNISKERSLKISKKPRRNGKSLADSSDSSYYDSPSDEEIKDSNYVRDHKKNSMNYELNHLDLMKQLILEKNSITSDKGVLLKQISNLSKGSKKIAVYSESDSEVDDNIDLQKELLKIFQEKGFSFNKFAFSPQIAFKFAQKYDMNPGLNVNEIEVTEYNIDANVFDSNLLKKRFLNTVTAFNEPNQVSNKRLQILNLEEMLPIEIQRKKLKAFDKLRKKERVMQTRGKIVEINGKPKLTFSNLIQTDRSSIGESVDRDNFIRSGGSNCPGDELYLKERIYCRIKNIFDLNSLSQRRRNSAEIIKKNLDDNTNILNKVAQN